MDFNNREIAVAIWSSIIVIALLFNKDIRQSIPDLLKAMLQIKIIVPVLILMAYISGMVYILFEVGFWKPFLIKNTILWFFFVGIVLFFRFGTSKEPEKLFKKTIIDSLKITIILEFIIDSYTLSLVGELILIPILSFIAILDSIIQTKKEYSQISKFTGILLSLTGFTMLFLASYSAISDYRSFGNINTLKSFMTPILLTFLILPFLYLMVLYSNYEQLFLRLNFGREKSNSLKRAAKKEIFKHCLFSIRKTNDALNMKLFNLMGIEDENDIEEMVKIYRQKI